MHASRWAWYPVVQIYEDLVEPLNSKISFVRYKRGVCRCLKSVPSLLLTFAGLLDRPRDDSGVKSADWNSVLQLSCGNSGAGKMFFLLKRAQTSWNQRWARSKARSESTHASFFDWSAPWVTSGKWRCQVYWWRFLWEKCMFARNGLWLEQTWMRPSLLLFKSTTIESRPLS